MGFSSPAQIAGYLAFIVGTSAFLQKCDRRLKFLNASQSLIYALHFIMLGNFAASSSSLVSSLRSFLALRYRSYFLAGGMIVLNLALGAMLVTTPASWLPVIASCAATVAIFTMQGVALRSVLLGCTLCWLVNNILSGSIGGTLLELVILAVNGTTILRMARDAGEGPATL